MLAAALAVYSAVSTSTLKDQPHNTVCPASELDSKGTLPLTMLSSAVRTASSVAGRNKEKRARACVSVSVA
jgi:hypothetical protein